MDADFYVELGHDDPALEFPWAASDGNLHYIDLKSHPELIAQIDEASQHPPLADFLVTVNSPESPFLTAKCDVWTETELSEAEELYDGSLKFCSYVDLLLEDDSTGRRFNFECHESLAKQLARLLDDSSPDPLAAEFIIRRCYFHAPNPDRAVQCEVREGFYITIYVFAYADDEDAARKLWSLGLARLQSAIIQISAGYAK